jgi:hypothetical protein
MLEPCKPFRCGADQVRLLREANSELSVQNKYLRDDRDSRRSYWSRVGLRILLLIGFWPPQCSADVMIGFYAPCLSCSA